MAKKVFELEGISAAPGTLGKGFIKVGEFSDNSPVNMPVMILNGASEGPTLLIMSSVHGNEVVGTEAIKRVMVLIYKYLPERGRKRPKATWRVADVKKLTAHISKPLEGIGFYELYIKVAKKTV